MNQIRTQLGGNLWVSTVELDYGQPFVGLCAALGMTGTKKFETMVFSYARRGDDLDVQQYDTEAEAVAGHAAMVAKWSKKVAAASKKKPSSRKAKTKTAVRSARRP